MSNNFLIKQNKKKLKQTNKKKHLWARFHSGCKFIIHLLGQSTDFH